MFYQINEKLSYYDYIFLIRIEEEETKEKTKACYHYYFFPAKVFKIDEIETIDFNKYKKKSSLSSKYWTFSCFTDFYFKYDDELLDIFYLCDPFVNC